MVNIPKFHELADKIFSHFEGRCVTMWQIIDYAKKLGYKTPSKTVSFAVRYLSMNGKAFSYRFYDDYNVYCFGREYRGEDLLDHREIRECIEQNMPSFNLATIVECIEGKKSIGRNIILHLAILYELMKMIRQRRIRYFVATTDAKNRFRILVDREITAEDLQRKA